MLFPAFHRRWGHARDRTAVPETAVSRIATGRPHRNPVLYSTPAATAILNAVPRSMNTYLKFGILMVLIVGCLVWLALGGIKDTRSYYKTIAELHQMGPAAQTQRLRVAGDIQPGSIVKNGMQVSFVLQQGPQKLNVIYSGNDPLPDTFRDNAQALADGRLAPNGTFEANKIQAKCASKYEAKPAQGVVSHPPTTPAT